MRWGPPAKRRGPASDTLRKQEEDWQWNVKVSYGTMPRPSGSVRNFACESSMINGARKPPGSTMSFRRFEGDCATPGTPIGGSAEMCGTTCDAASTHWWRSYPWWMASPCAVHPVLVKFTVQLPPTRTVRAELEQE
jgi:hypothetical protein